MKISEFRKLIREEIKRVIKEVEITGGQFAGYKGMLIYVHGKTKLKLKIAAINIYFVIDIDKNLVKKSVIK